MSSSNQRLIRRQYLRNAEGYLELATVFDDRWPLPQELRSSLALQALACLSSVIRTTIRSSAVINSTDESSSSDSVERADVCFLRGLSFELLEEFETAAEQLNRSLEIDPLQADAYSHLAWCHRQLEHWDLAVGALTRGLRRFPENAIFFYNAACYSCLAGNDDDCLYYLLQAIRLDRSLVQQAEVEEDLGTLRKDSRFIALLELSSKHLKHN